MSVMAATCSRLALHPLFAEANRRARRRRGLVAATVLALLIGGGLTPAIRGSIPPSIGSSASAETVSDSVLRGALLPGWSASVGPGFYRTHPQAWILVGAFRLPRDAAQHEGSPQVPAGSVLVTVGDFYVEGLSRHWPAVRILRMPRALMVSARWWSVRYEGRALLIRATFGSAPTLALENNVQRILRGLHRTT
jgi:hypothetical protein